MRSAFHRLLDVEREIRRIHRWIGLDCFGPDDRAHAIRLLQNLARRKHELRIRLRRRRGNVVNY